MGKLLEILNNRTGAILLLAALGAANASACPFPAYSPKASNIKKGSCSGHCLQIDPKTGEMLEKNAEGAAKQSAFSKNIIITSGCRTPAHNQSLPGGRPNGGHTRGTAVDSNPEDRKCEPYKKMAEQANGKTFITCNHGTAPHLHMDSNSPPCNNCGKETDYKRKPEDQKQEQQQAGGGSPPGGGGAPGGGSPGGGSPQAEQAAYPEPRYDNRDTADLIKAMDQPAQSRTSGRNQAPGAIVDIKKTDPKDPSQITRTPDESFARFSGSSAPAFGVEAALETHGNGGSKPSSNGAGSPGGGLGGLDGGGGGKAGGEPAAAAAVVPGGSSYSSAGGGGGGGGSSSSEFASPFGKPLSEPKMTLAGSETEALANNLVSDLMGGDVNREPASEELGEIGGINGASLFERVHGSLERCLRKGCIARGGS